jgi:hypothetical protein
MRILPTNLNIVLVLGFVFVLRYLVLQYIPKIIINGYFAIFLCFFIITRIFADNILFAILVGLLSSNLRIVYSHFKDPSVLSLSDYNNISNMVAFFLALIVWVILIKNYKSLNALLTKQYGVLILAFILIQMAALTPSKHDYNLVCLD